MTTELATAQANVPDYIKKDTTHAGAGVDTIDVEMTSYVHLCQPLSPEVIEAEACQAGTYVARPDGHIFTEGLQFIVIGYKREWVKWKPKDDGGGIIWRGQLAELDDDQIKQTQWGKDGEPPEANDTINFAIVEYDYENDKLDPMDLGPMIMSLSRTSFVAAKNIATKIKKYGGKETPIFALALDATSKKETNEHGTFFVVETTSLGAIRSEKSYLEAAVMYDAFEEMVVRTPDDTKKKEPEADS